MSADFLFGAGLTILIMIIIIPTTPEKPDDENDYY